MKKRYFALFLTSLLVTSGCSKDVHILDKYRINEGSLNLMSDSFKKYDISFDSTKLTNLYSELTTAIKTKNVSEVKRIAGLCSGEGQILVDKVCFSEAKYFANPNEETRAAYDDLYDKYGNYSILDAHACEEAKKSGVQEIIDVVVGPNTITPSDPEREKELSEIILEYNLKAEELDLNRDSYSLEEYLKAGVSLFCEYAPYCDEYATLFGYDHFLEYSYKNEYHRSYTPTEATSFTSLVKKDIAPKYKPLDLSKYDKSTQEKISKASTSCFALKEFNLGEQLDKYASYVDNEYLKTYENCFNNGYFVFSNNKESLATAGTYSLNESKNHGMLYFSKNYQDAFTVIHEFGHYFSFDVNQISINKSYDLNETFSQGNEMLFATYLLNETKSDFLHGIAEENINSLFQGLLKISYTVDVENYLFTNYTSKNEEELYNGVRQIYKDFNVSSFKEDYWVYPVINSTGYYISYATSIAQSLQIGTLANDKFSKGYDVYLNLIKQDQLYGEVEAWEKAGLSSPFKESTLIEIAKYFD